LPTSLTYIILSARGWTPWTPVVDMGTFIDWPNAYPSCFQRTRTRCRHDRTHHALRPGLPHLVLMSFRGSLDLSQRRDLSLHLSLPSTMRDDCYQSRTLSLWTKSMGLEAQPVSLSLQGPPSKDGEAYITFLRLD